MDVIKKRRRSSSVVDGFFWRGILLAWHFERGSLRLLPTNDAPHCHLIGCANRCVLQNQMFVFLHSWPKHCVLSRCLFVCIRESFHVIMPVFCLMCMRAFRDNMLCWRIHVFACVSTKKDTIWHISHPTSRFLLLLIFHPQIIINDMMKSTERVVCSTHK